MGMSRAPQPPFGMQTAANRQDGIKAGGMDGTDREGAEAFTAGSPGHCEEVGAIVGQNINMMDPEGYVIASRIRSESARFMRGQENRSGSIWMSCM